MGTPGGVRTSSPSGLENLARDMGTQEFWVRRLVAFLLDWFLCLGALWAAGLEPFSLRIYSGSALAGLLLFAYSASAEYFTGQTLGKAVMGLRLAGVGRKADLSRLLIREVSKAFPLALLLDTVAGVLADSSGRRRYLEVLSNTTLVVEGR
ncbi:MAG TPA: RDD family protein [Candidatus Thermoplasmatota archaeon]